MLRKKLFKMRLISALLASIELANVGMSSHAINPSDAKTLTSESETEKDIPVTIFDKMANMSSEKLLEYLKTGSTVEELRRCYENGKLDKSRKDVINFGLLDEKTKNQFFEYVLKIIAEENLSKKDFRKLPVQIRTEFFNYIIAQKYDIKNILIDLGVPDYKVNADTIMQFIIKLADIVPPTVSREIYRIINNDEDVIADAIFSKEMSQLEELIAHEADFNYDSKTKSGCTLIDYAALFGNVKAFKFFLLNGATITEKTKEIALIGGNTEIIHIVANSANGYGPQQGDLDMLKCVIGNNDEDLFDWLLLQYDKAETAVLACCEVGSLSFLVKAFIGKEYTQNLLNDALIKAISNNDTELIKFLLDNGTKVDAMAFEHTIRYSSFRMFNFLVENGADINTKFSNGISLLHVAATFDNLDVANFLIENGIDIDAKTSEGNTALMYAAGNCSNRIAKLLIENGADINLADNDGVTALMLSVTRDYGDLTDFLIKNGAEINAADKQGQTVLMYAINACNVDLAQLLIDNGADPNAVDKHGKTALDFASKSNRDAVAKILRGSICRI